MGEMLTACTESRFKCHFFRSLKCRMEGLRIEEATLERLYESFQEEL